MAPLTFADTHNMIAFLTKSDASEGFDQIVDFVNAHTIQCALMVNPTIYVLCINQFWALVSIKKFNDAVKLQALIDRKKVIITKDTIRKNLRLDDADVQDDAEVEEDEENEVPAAPTPPSPTPATTLPLQQEPIPLPPQGLNPQLTLLWMIKMMHPNRGKIGQLDVNEDVTLLDVDVNIQGRMAESQAKVYNLDLQHSETVFSMKDTDETEPAEMEEVKPKDKEKGILIEEPKPLKGQAHIDIDEAFARQLEAELNANINWNDVMETKMMYLKNMARFKIDFFKAKKQRIDEDAEELKRHLHIIANDDDDVYTEATPLASKVPVVDYQIHLENNKPYYKIIRADGTHKLFLSFITFLKNFDREDLETLWKLVKEIFKSIEPKNFSDDFLLNTLKIMFEKLNVEANVWRDQKGRYGLAKVKRWKLFESCRVHIITLITTQMILLVEKKYPLTRFTLE
nr:hypothetical protein [Tanacetum cinerariifolium]